MEFKIELCLIMHLQWHSLDYVNLLREKKIKTILFLYDFFYYCPIPYLPASKEEDYRLWMCKFEGDEKCQECKLRGLWPDVDVFAQRKLMGKMLREDFEYVIFLSEFVLERYRELFDLPERKEYVVSYPEFI